jgi:hypothetical protein
MARYSLLVVVLFTSPCRAEPPELLREKPFTCATLAAAVNHYVGLGEAAALKELDGLALDWRADHRIDREVKFRRNERIGWVCRILFEPKGTDPLWQPAFGALSLPDRTMPLSRWPLYPVAASGSSYFVLSEGYTLGGVPQEMKEYLAYCKANGKFRAKPVETPTRVQALRDADALRASAAWKAIKWTDSGTGFSYFFREEDVWDFIRGQAERMPAK